MTCLFKFRLQARRTLAPIGYLPRSASFSMSASNTSSKRKIVEDDALEDGPSSQSQTTATHESQSQASQSSKTKKARTTLEHVNKVLPANISFHARIEGTLRIATWNICGWAASQKKVNEKIYMALWLFIDFKGISTLCRSRGPRYSRIGGDQGETANEFNSKTIRPPHINRNRSMMYLLIHH